MDFAVTRAAETPANGAAISTPKQANAEQAPAQRELIRAVKTVNESGALGQDRELTFALDRETKRVVVWLVDKTTREVFLQIPSERVLRLAEETSA